ncbi:TonB-dependent receptor [Psychroflexus sp. MES1-P1E]|uniref:TonB-dependent receptor n=1 Tax=Psychroflexus sp. MES1-P1E TaxID=2058320 RepID=UPI000C795A8A|nr:TonB-dependent receptor [Psychroflexus sp. MES1-P1E]PKG43318.1 TonB-dependent receptor [Psychroflexus sp. MES1-P1E]
MRVLLVLSLLLFGTQIIAQHQISGAIKGQRGLPITGANVYIVGSYDGATTNLEGKFSFSTSETGIKTLYVSFLSFEDYSLTADLSEFKNLEIKLKEDVNMLDAVMLSTGTFEAGENSRVTALKPLDVVTTASALGDFLGALQTLPGTSTVGEDGRLFIRGGGADETQIFIDGMRVFAPYTPTANNIPTRGRFSPFLFKGISFSTGGYSAEYGQALSGVLKLNTIDEPDQEKTEVSLMTVGLGVGNTQKWDKSSLSINANYTNLAPYTEALPNRNEWISPLQSMSGEMIYRYKTNNSDILKLYGGYSYTDLDLIQQNINFEEGFRFANENRNLYINGSYKSFLGNSWILNTGFSLSNDNNKSQVGEDLIDNNDNSAHLKIKLRKRINNNFEFNFGSEYFITDFDESIESNLIGDFDYGFQSNISAGFGEVDIFFSKKLAMNLGGRVDHYELWNQTLFSPRASIAYKSGEFSQFSFAYGKFFQNPSADFLKFNDTITAENASHFIANFQYVKSKKIFRVEAYHKTYDDLVKFDTEFPTFTSSYNSTGSGYASGVDLFWRDNESFKNLEYWASYSYLDTERDYRNFLEKARPAFASEHNLSLVAKYWIEDWKSQLGFSHVFASGRNYTDPNSNGFLNRETKNFNSLSLNWAYLIDKQKILYFSVSNVLGTRNIFGYNYANEMDMSGVFQREAILPNTDQFFFVGFFWTLSDDKKSNQLNNL